METKVKAEVERRMIMLEALSSQTEERTVIDVNVEKIFDLLVVHVFFGCALPVLAGNKSG